MARNLSRRWTRTRPGGDSARVAAPENRFSLARALGLGVLCALGGGGLMLLAFGVRGLFFPPPCTAPGTSECAMEQELLGALAKRQSLIGGLLVVLAVSAFFYSRLRQADREDPA